MSGSSRYPKSFDYPGDWNNTSGPVVMMPQPLRNVEIEPVFLVEFHHPSIESVRSTSVPEPLGFENHIAIRVTFANPYRFNGADYPSARISILPKNIDYFRLYNTDEETSNRVGRVNPATTLIVGVFTIQLFSYKSMCRSSLCNVTFDILQPGLTLGYLLGLAVINKMHHFCFRVNDTHRREQWKGCRDFVLQYWWLLVKKGIVSSKDKTGKSLAYYASRLYLSFGEYEQMAVDQGSFLSFSADRHSFPDAYSTQ
ncbi:hypothetical protein H2248_005488 [Termitomyces sp. 'cryptogamus']|nr:hypothetical protein H2248_005488 [Termitomyces sp. 'cryptogamus']